MKNSPLCKIREIYKAISEYESKISRDYGLSLNEGMLLCCLSEHGILSASEIAGFLGLTRSNTSKVIKSAESKNLVQRALNDKDKRGMLFSITAEGEDDMKRLIADTNGIPEILRKMLDNQ
ncbi:MAG: MarR family transcriptional regulator [Bacteroidales bacterium]|jgi:DNA-binding MarR family transcriptional regulator|nr:MarR family transcriptional regulator [Bacteroidales bacterium]MCI2146099.1 MarR family transcriptional regulator [Bacteroidales bacterium]